MSLKESTEKASEAAETLCDAIRALAKTSDEVDPLFGHIVQNQIPKANELKNMLVLIEGAAKRREVQPQREKGKR